MYIYIYIYIYICIYIYILIRCRSFEQYGINTAGFQLMFSLCTIFRIYCAIVQVASYCADHPIQIILAYKYLF